MDFVIPLPALDVWQGLGAVVVCVALWFVLLFVAAMLFEKATQVMWVRGGTARVWSAGIVSVLALVGGLVGPLWLEMEGTQDGIAWAGGALVEWCVGMVLGMTTPAVLFGLAYWRSERIPELEVREAEREAEERRQERAASERRASEVAAERDREQRVLQLERELAEAEAEAERLAKEAERAAQEAERKARG